MYNLYTMIVFSKTNKFCGFAPWKMQWQVMAFKISRYANTENLHHVHDYSLEMSYQMYLMCMGLVNKLLWQQKLNVWIFLCCVYDLWELAAMTVNGIIKVMIL